MADNPINTPEKMWDLYKEKIEIGNLNWVLSDKRFEHMTIKDARQLADEISNNAIRNMRDYHASMTALNKQS